MTAKDGRPCVRCGDSRWGERNRCITCATNRHREWVKNNPERTKELKRESYARHSEENRERDRKRRAENPELYRERGRASRARNIERAREHDRQRNQANPRRSREATLKWYRANKEHHLSVGQKWRKENREATCAISARRRARIYGNEGDYTGVEFKKLCSQYDNRCLACGRNDIPLTADHIVPVSCGGSNYIDNIQPLCQSCNSSKGTKTIDYRQGVKSTSIKQLSLFSR